MLSKDNILINPEIRIETTNRCQAKCKICPHDQMTRRQETMSFQTFTYIVSQLMKYKPEMVTLFGMGEPLMDKGLIEKIEFCTQHGLDTFITTNAGLLDFEMINGLIEAGLTMIRFSIHAEIDKDTQERNISNFISTNQIKFNNQVETHISIVLEGSFVNFVTGLPEEKIKDLMIKIWEPHVDYLEIWKPHNWAGAKTYRIIDRKKNTCGRPFCGPLQVNVDGYVMICCFDYNSEMTIGNLNHQSLEEILQGESYECIKAAHEVGVIQMLPCVNCDQLNEYTDENNPLLYSNRDKNKTLGKTSSNKFNLGDYI